MTRIALLLAVLGAACGRRPPIVTLEAGPPLRLVAATGARINARLKPALELDDGTVVRFDSSRLTSDSAYFAAAPTAAPPAGGSRHGTLQIGRASWRERV